MSLLFLNAQPKAKRIQLNEITMQYYEWGKRGDPVILFLHATGFHARVWDATVRMLKHPFHVFCVDLRGHGLTNKTPPFDWYTIGGDVVAFVDALQLENVLAVGHSMGGYCAIYACSQRHDQFRGLVLVDPVVGSPEMETVRVEVHSFGSVENHPVARRRNRWSSPDEMFERFVNRSPFSLWRKDVLRDYCQWGLTQENESYVLCCPPPVEAEIYTNFHRRGEIYAAIKRVHHPVTVMRAKDGLMTSDNAPGSLDFSSSPTWPLLAQQFDDGRDRHFPELTHFIPMQQPEVVVQEIEALRAR